MLNPTTTVFLLPNSTARAIMCTYENKQNEIPVMFKTLDPTVKKDNYVLVQTNTRHLMTVCKVVEVDVDVDYDSSTPVTWIIDKVDILPVQKLIEYEAQANKIIRDAEVNAKKKKLQTDLLASAEGLKDLPLLTTDNLLAAPVVDNTAA
jgi:hypothetical protein